MAAPDEGGQWAQDSHVECLAPREHAGTVPGHWERDLDSLQRLNQSSGPPGHSFWPEGPSLNPNTDIFRLVSPHLSGEELPRPPHNSDFLPLDPVLCSSRVFLRGARGGGGRRGRALHLPSLGHQLLRGPASAHTVNLTLCQLGAGKDTLLFPPGTTTSHLPSSSTVGQRCRPCTQLLHSSLGPCAQGRTAWQHLGSLRPPGPPRLGGGGCADGI